MGEAAKNHTPTIRLLGSQVATALQACGELRSDVRALDTRLDGIEVGLARQEGASPAMCSGCQELKVEVARLRERATIGAGVLAVIQVLGMAIAAYLASR